MTVRRLVLVLLALLLILAGADVAYWNWAANRMRDGIHAWIAQATAQGWQVRTGALTITGWPNAVIADLPNVHIDHDPNPRAGSFPVRVRFESTDLKLVVSLFRPTTMSLDLHGEQKVTLANLPTMLLTADRLEALLPLTEDGRGPVTFDGNAVRVGPAAKTWTARVGTLGGQIETADADSAPTALDFTGTAAAIELPSNFKYPLGSMVQHVSVGGTLNGPFPHGGDLAASATAWRDAGGSLEVKQAALDWGALRMTSTATLALDDQLQPMGSGSAKVTGYEEALDRLAASGVLTRSAATVAKAMLSLLAGTGTGDAPSEVEVPLTLQYRTLSMRQVPLVRLPELDWTLP